MHLAIAGNDDKFSHGIAGDICLGLGVIDVVGQRGTEFLFEPVRPYFDQIDLMVGNLECYVADDDATPVAARPLRVPLDVAEVITQSGIDAFGLASNHILDGGADGLRMAQDYVDRNSLKHFGSGMLLNQAEAALYMEVGGHRLALLGACDAAANWAGKKRAGVAP